ncbi:MAG: hypothetical protein SFV17_01770 [Candidatus Obscuribacter sp.]|nr:hypothetical protein [Candidatus Melainabacteria bacterium]MBK8222732.1 hypothetical protein [Candidatus Obscuribacter sp.]MBK9278657.1 hypothetical protein [Candidatus Obscuribacter sp.]MBL8081272.1 hypothetical protein [Candidatus Obscuribacter sp.]MDX1985391.1 hypothetical protein [Candidatus Obscuribacter sp.]
MLNLKFLPIITAITLGAAFNSAAQAASPGPWPGSPPQVGPAPGGPVTTLRTPLIPGQQTGAPFMSPIEGAPPAIGDGPTPVPVTPGMGGAPTLLPWVPSIPANQIDNSFSGIPLPVSPAVVSPPGVLGPSLTGIVPAPPSTPGADPGSLTAPIGMINPSQQVNIIPTGGIAGTGGYYTSIPTVRRGGQETHQWDLRGRNSMIGMGPDDGSQDNVERLGPWAGWGAVTGVPTGNGLRHNSIDLGGGQRFQAGGNVISTGSTIQDFGLSATRNNPIGALSANQSYEFGQGFRRMPVYTNKTTDFGLPFTQFSPANITAQKTGQRLLPTAVITNF